MRLETNFIKPVTRGAPIVGLLLWSLSILVLVAAFWMWRSADSVQRENRNLEARLAQIAERLQAQEPLLAVAYSQQAIDDLQARVDAINALPGVGAQSITSHLALLERLMPRDVQLIRLHHEQKRGQVILVAESRSIASLTGFMKQLEGNAAIAEVLLQKQHQTSDGGESRLQFEILIRERG